MKIAGNGSTSRLYQKLVSEEKLASSAGGWYSGQGLDSGSIGVYAVAAQGVGLDKVEAGDRPRPARAAREAASPQTSSSAPRRPSSPSSSTSPTARARSPGATAQGMLLGLTIEQINAWPAAIAKVTAEDVKRAAAKYFDIRRSVTGTLIPTAPDAGSDCRAKPAADKS